jgi:hypothetical protein
MRAGDADRQAAVDRLTEHLTAGRLDLTEFDERVAKAYAVTYLDQLPELFSDLPELKGPETKSPGPRGRRGFATATPWSPPAGSMPGGQSAGGVAGPNSQYPPAGPLGYPGPGRWFAGQAVRLLLIIAVVVGVFALLFASRGMFLIPLFFITMGMFRGGRRGRPWGGPGRPPWR